MINSWICGILFSTCIIAMVQFGTVGANSTLTCCDEKNQCICQNFLDEPAFSEIVVNIIEDARASNLKCKSENLFSYYDESIEDCANCSNICSSRASVYCLETCEGYLVKVDADRKREELENRTTAEILRFKEKLLNSEKKQEDLNIISIVLAVASLCWLLGLTVAVARHIRRNNTEMGEMKRSVNKYEEYVKDPHPVPNTDDRHGAGSEHSRHTTSNGGPASCQF